MLSISCKSTTLRYIISSLKHIHKFELKLLYLSPRHRGRTGSARDSWWRPWRSS